MKMFIQWATDPASDWEEIDHTDWKDIKFTPFQYVDSSMSIGPTKRYVNQISCYGMVFNGHDHYSVCELGDEHFKITAWRDSSIYSFGGNQAVIYEFNTTGIVGQKTFSFDSWKDFKSPECKIGHGIMLNDSSFKALCSYKEPTLDVYL